MRFFIVFISTFLVVWIGVISLNLFYNMGLSLISYLVGLPGILFVVAPAWNFWKNYFNIHFGISKDNNDE